MTKKPEKGTSRSFIYGYHTVMAVLTHQPKRCKKLFIARKQDHNTIINLAQKHGITYEIVDRTYLDKHFSVSSDAQGLVALTTGFFYHDFDDLVQKSRRLLVLDSWQDTVNLGRAARASRCFGADGMVILKDRSAEITAASEKAAVGALAQVPVARVVNLASALKKMKEANFFVYGADERGQTSLKDCDFAQKSALVIGQEGEGLRELTKKTCDVIVQIPMANSDICLNAADTAVIMLYEIFSRQL